MDFKDIIKQINDIEVDVQAKDKFDLLKKISQYISRKIGKDAETIYDLLRERELLGSTAIGNGFALPHLKLKGINSSIYLFILKRPIDFDSIDNIFVSVVFTVLSPSEKPSLQLKTLTQLAKMLKKLDVENFTNKTKEEVISFLKTFEQNENQEIRIY